MKGLLPTLYKKSILSFCLLLATTLVIWAQPTFTSVPLASTTNVNQSANIVLTFSEAIQRTTGGALNSTNIDNRITLKLSNSGGADIFLMQPLMVQKPL
ncbi:MAG: Ig-like domain-containing protein [Flammeovirgaceae bacterium]|nr:Ig-like domain-containing protein [Flammeovirgaceae bacterium]